MLKQIWENCNFAWNNLAKWDKTTKYRKNPPTDPTKATFEMTKHTKPQTRKTNFFNRKVEKLQEKTVKKTYEIFHRISEDLNKDFYYGRLFQKTCLHAWVLHKVNQKFVFATDYYLNITIFGKPSSLTISIISFKN